MMKGGKGVLKEDRAWLEEEQQDWWCYNRVCVGLGGGLQGRAVPYVAWDVIYTHVV